MSCIVVHNPTAISTFLVHGPTTEISYGKQLRRFISNFNPPTTINTNTSSGSLYSGVQLGCWTKAYLRSLYSKTVV